MCAHTFKCMFMCVRMSVRSQNLTLGAFVGHSLLCILIWGVGLLNRKLTDWLDWLAIKGLGSTCLCTLLSHTKWELQMQFLCQAFKWMLVS